MKKILDIKNLGPTEEKFIEDYVEKVLFRIMDDDKKVLDKMVINRVTGLAERFCKVRDMYRRMSDEDLDEIFVKSFMGQVNRKYKLNSKKLNELVDKLWRRYE